MLINPCKDDLINLNSFWVRVYQKFKVPVKLPLSGTFFDKFTHSIEPIVLFCYFWGYISLLGIQFLLVV